MSSSGSSGSSGGSGSSGSGGSGGSSGSRLLLLLSTWPTPVKLGGTYSKRRFAGCSCTHLMKLDLTYEEKLRVWWRLSYT